MKVSISVWALLCLIFGALPLEGRTILVSVSINIVSPDRLVIHVGDTVVWRSAGGATPVFTLESYDGEWPVTALSEQTPTFSHTFIRPGVFTYITHMITGRSEYNSAGVITVRPVTNDLPSVILHSPVEGSYFSAVSRVLVVASVGETNPPHRVDFLSGTNLLGSDTNAPYELSFQLAYPSSVGLFPLRARTVRGNGMTELSEAIFILVDPPPSARLYGMRRLSNGHCRLYFTSSDPYKWVLQSSEDLKTWTDRGPGMAGPRSSGTWIDEGTATVHQRFYRSAPTFGLRSLREF